MGVPIRFIHCADLHLGRKFVGISSDDPELGKRMIASTFDALEKIVETANRVAVDFVLFVGDIFDDSSETPYTRSRFVDAVSRINAQCYIAYGNHDYERKWEDSIPMPKNAYVFGDEVERVMFPQDDPLIEIIGVSYSKKVVKEDLTKKFDGMEGIFTIGLLHCDVDGEPDSSYSPCRSSEMSRRGVDYWALGHIHRRRTVSTDPYIIYPGNTQGTNPKETDPKGAYVVTVNDGSVAKMDFFQTSTILWEDVSVQISSGDTDISELMRRIMSECTPGSFARITIGGSGPLDRQLRLEKDGIKELFDKTSGCRCTDLLIETSPDMDFSQRKNTGDFISAVIDYGVALTSKNKSELIDMICSSNASTAYLRPRLESLPPDELRKMIDDSVKLIIEKMGAYGR